MNLCVLEDIQVLTQVLVIIFINFLGISITASVIYEIIQVEVTLYKIFKNILIDILAIIHKDMDYSSINYFKVFKNKKTYFFNIVLIKACILKNLSIL